MMSVWTVLFVAFTLSALSEPSSHVSAQQGDPPPYKIVDWEKAGQDVLRGKLKEKRNLNTAKNAILFIGDGMGMSSITGGRIYKGQQKGNTGEEEVLNFDTFPSIGLAKTYAVDWQVAQSAETATAYLCGVKTKFKTCGMKQGVVRGDCTTQVPANYATSNIMRAEAAGKSTGLVTDTRVTHASPANVYSHVAHRKWEADTDISADQKQKCPNMKDIAAQMIENAIDMEVVMGGGRQNFLPNTQSDPEYPNKKGKRADGQNLIKQWIDKQKQKNKRASFVWNETALNDLDIDKTDRLLGLFETSHLKYYDERKDSKDPTLENMVEKAIKLLRKNDKGYFLFVEGGRIDHAHHQSWGKRALIQTVELEKAVQKAMDMTDEDDTLIVVTADHSSAMVIQGHALRGTNILGLDNTPVEPALDKKNITILAYSNGPGWKAVRENVTFAQAEDILYRQQSAMPTEYATHSGEDVPVYARGPMAHLLTGVYEQNYIAHAMAYAACIGEDDKDSKRCTSSSTVLLANLNVILLVSTLALFLKF